MIPLEKKCSLSLEGLRPTIIYNIRVIYLIKLTLFLHGGTTWTCQAKGGEHFVGC